MEFFLVSGFLQDVRCEINDDVSELLVGPICTPVKMGPTGSSETLSINSLRTPCKKKSGTRKRYLFHSESLKSREMKCLDARCLLPYLARPICLLF